MKKLLLTACLLASVSFPALAADQPDESTFDRIVRTGVIRCGYYVFPPITYRDANTNELSGLSYDYMNRIAEKAGLKVEWTTEITWANWVSELQAGRYDMACTPMWPDMPQLKVVQFTEPMFFAGLYPLVRKDDERFANATWETLNSPDVTFTAQEGNVMYSVVQANFPKAKIFALQPSASGGEYYQALTTKKSDVSITDPNGLFFYEKENGKNFRFVEPHRPLKLQSFNLAVLRGDEDLLHFLNQSMRDLDYNGETDRILKKWEPEPGKTFLRVNQAYKDAQ